MTPSVLPLLAGLLGFARSSLGSGISITLVTSDVPLVPSGALRFADNYADFLPRLELWIQPETNTGVIDQARLLLLAVDHDRRSRSEAVALQD